MILKKLTFERDVRLRVSTPYAALFTASRSDLIATVPAGLATNVAAGLDLACLKLPLETEDIAMVQAWHPRWQADVAHQWLRQCVLSSLTFSPTINSGIKRER
jgi:DNA-binding transcriptional LysR family regulator